VGWEDMVVPSRHPAAVFVIVLLELLSSFV